MRFVQFIAAGFALASFIPNIATAAPGDHGEILWDSYGVGHVYAKSEPDLFRGYGWAQAKSHATCC